MLEMTSIRPALGRSFRENVPEEGAVDAFIANLRMFTPDRGPLSIIDCICLLNCLLPFIPLIIFRLLFHCASNALTSFSDEPDPLAILLIRSDLRILGSSFSPGH